jgi:hypothetical protein
VAMQMLGPVSQPQHHVSPSHTPFYAHVTTLGPTYYLHRYLAHAPCPLSFLRLFLRLFATPAVPSQLCQRQHPLDNKQWGTRMEQQQQPDSWCAWPHPA